MPLLALNPKRLSLAADVYPFRVSSTTKNQRIDFSSERDLESAVLHGVAVPRRPANMTDAQSHAKKTSVVKVELFANERSTRDQLYLFFFKNKTTNVVVHFSLLCFKLVTCALYVIRVILDDASEADCYGCVAFPCRHLKEYEWPKNCSEMEGNSELLCWSALLWVQNPTSIWGLQVAIAIWTLSLTIFLGGLKYKGEFWRIVDLYFFVEVITTVPFLVTLFHSPLRNVFIPVFLNCWLAKRTLEHMFIHHKYFQTTNLLSHQVLAVASTMICLAFTSICGFQHIQRVGCRRYNLFESSYFVAITLTTVGYGDLFPDVWLSKFFMVTMILLALALMPKKFESLAFSWMERQKVGGSYNKSSRRPDRHVVVCSTQVTADTLTDFLTEFFSYRQLMDVSVVVLSPSDLDIEMRQVLAVPIWAQKVYYIKGSCLKDSDLRRVRMKDSDACFILGIDSTVNKTVADEHTILRSWAVKDFAPNVPQYVQIFRPENKVHIKFAEFVVCEDEVKYAMLAYNCICPGASTMLTLLLHTSRGEEGQTCKDEWIRLYGRGSGNEVYHVILKDSLIFSEYAGRSFTYTSLHTHRRYGVVLIGTKSTHDAKESYIKLNPGPSHVMRETDICFYLSISREENMNFSVDDKSEASPFTSKLHKVGDMIFRRNLKSIRPVPRGPGRNGGHLPDYNEHNASPTREKSYDEDPLWLQDSEECEIVMDYPRVTPYIGASPTLCHIRSEKKKVCCMELTRDCEHCRYRNVQEYHWPNPTIILVAEQGNSGVYNFIVPLRAHYLSKGSLQPIILLLEKRPDPSFLDVIAWFPLVYFMQGCIKNLDDLLRAGIIIADNVVVVNKDGDASVKEEDLADSNTIVAVQSVLELFPTVKITTELSQSSNMRFMHFQASNAYALYLSDIEKREMERGSNISFMFRLQFASGSVFSANMMDTLLYQAFVKDYIIIIMRLILGIDQAPGSGYLTSMKVTSKELKLGTYGSLFAELCATGGDVPICIYRTQVDIGASAHDSEETDVSSLESWESFTKDVENTEINNLVTSRMLNLGIKTSGYEHTTEQQTSVSYVIINPSCDLNLEEGDIIFVLRPNRLKSYPIYRRASTTSRSTQTLNKPSGPPASDGSYSSLQSHPSTFNSANDVTAPGHTPRTRLVAPDSIEQFQYDRQHHL